MLPYGHHIIIFPTRISRKTFSLTGVLGLLVDSVDEVVLRIMLIVSGSSNSGASDLCASGAHLSTGMREREPQR